MTKPSHLSETDVRDMVRLLGENITLKGDVSDKRRHLMTGLCQLVGGDSWCWAMVAEIHPEKLPVYIGFIQGGFSEESFARYLKVHTHPDMIWLTAPFSREVCATNKHVTRVAQQVISFPEFLKSEVSQLWRESGFYPGILSFYPVPGGIFSAIAVYRNHERALFGERERKIAHILMSEVSWLHLQHSTESATAEVPKLPIRQRLALEFLLQGKSRKNIAAEMEISINTVAGYVRDIYRFFNVTSQAELIRRFFHGDGGDIA